MTNLLIAFRFIRKSIIRSLAILLIVALGVGVLFFVLTLGNMLTNMILKQTTSYQEHIIAKTEEEISLDNLDYDFLNEVINTVPNITAGLITTHLEGIISGDKINKPAIPFTIIGVSNSNTSHSFYGLDKDDHLVSGRLNNELENEIILDDYFAKQHHIELNDIIVFNFNLEFKVVGTFDLGLFKDSRAYAYVPLSLLNINDELTYNFVFQTNEPLDTKKTISKIEKINSNFTITTWQDTNPLFESLNLAQKTVVIMIELMIALGIFTIILSLLNFSIKQKYKQIGFLKAMGITNKDVNKIFILQSAILTILGTILGIASGTLTMIIYGNYMVYPDGTPRFTYQLLWYNYLFTIVLIFSTILLSTLAAINRIKKTSIIELIKI